MKIQALRVLAISLSLSVFSSIFSTQAFAVLQYVDCLRSDSQERVIINVYDDRSSGTLFFTTGVGQDGEQRTEALNLHQVQTNSDFVIFEASDLKTVFTVEFPAELIHQSSSSFLMMIGSHSVTNAFTSGIQFACFSSLHDR